MTVTPAAAPSPGHAGRAWLVLSVCSMSVFLTGLDAAITTIALPAIGRSLHAGISGLQWSVTGYTVTLASLLMTAGAAADRIGRRQVLQAGLSLFVLGSWLCTLAPSLSWLIAARVIQGAGASCMNPAALGIITSTITSPARRARAIGVWDAAYGLSLVAGPLAGGVLIRLAGWHAIFYPGIVAGLAALALTSLVAPESRAPRPRRPDPAGQVLVTIVLAALATAVIQGPAWGWLAPRTAALAVLAAAALAALLRAEARRPDPLIQLALFRRASFTGACLMGTCGIAALAGAGFLCSLYLQDARSMSALQAAVAIWPMPAAMAACAPLAGLIIARHGSRIPAIAAGTTLAASSLALTRLTGRAISPAYATTIAYALFGSGMGLLSPAITYAIMSGVPNGQAGLASAMNSSSRQVGQCLGVALTGTVVASSLHGTTLSRYPDATRAGWWLIAGCGLCVLLAGLASTPRHALDWQAVQARLSLVKRRWDLAILCHLDDTAGCRPADLLAAINSEAGNNRQLSPQVLSRRLRELEPIGYVRHQDVSLMPLRRLYYLQPPGLALISDLLRIMDPAQPVGRPIMAGDPATAASPNPEPC